jgi:hypothetical protein
VYQKLIEHFGEQLVGIIRVECLLSYIQDLVTRRINDEAAPSFQSGAAGRRSSGIREILAKLEFNIFKNVAHRAGATIFWEHSLICSPPGAAFASINDATAGVTPK